MVPMLNISYHLLVAVYLFDAFTCIVHLTYQLGLGRETSEISPDVVNSHLTQYLHWGREFYEGGEVQHLNFHLGYWNVESEQVTGPSASKYC